MYALDIPSFCSGRLLTYLVESLPLIGKANAVALVLAARVNWATDSAYGARGAVEHLTVGAIAEKAKCSRSTVFEHLAALRSAGIIDSEPVKDRRGNTLYSRYWFVGFVAWLRKAASDDQVEQRGEQAPQEAGRGASGFSDPKQEKGSNTKKEDQKIDLGETSTVRFTSLERLIRSERPKLSDGSVADAQLVYERFRSMNLRKGQKVLPLSALRAFARGFRDFRQAKRPRRSSSENTTPPAKMQRQNPAPEFDASPVGAMMRSVWEQNPDHYRCWFAPLTVEKTEAGFELTAPSKFHRDYLRSHWGELLKGFSRQGELIALA